nr:integrase, catalytic region, zinc finger, CCHC-type, peptidase aspartic, catalytic [Tanacetum cinerariifolium]
MEKMIAKAILQERGNIQAQISSQIQQAIDNPHDDAHPEGEKSAKRQKTTEYETYVSGESSSRHDNKQEQGPSTSGNQEQADDYDFWTDFYASDDDEIPTKQVSQDIMKEVSLNVDEAKLKKIADEMLRQRWPEKIVLSLHKFPIVVFNDDDIEKRTSRWVNKSVKKFNPYARYGVEHWKNPHAKIFFIRKQKEPGKPKEVIYSNLKIIQVIKTHWELGHEHKFITEIIARRANDCIMSITEPNFKNLNKNDIEDMYLLIMNGKLVSKTALLCLTRRTMFHGRLVFSEWSRHVTIVHQTKDLHTADYTQLYDFLKYNQKEVDELKAERLVKIQDPLALMLISNNPYTFPVLHQDQPSFNQNYMQQPMPNPEDITDPTTTMSMALALMAKAFKLNYSTPTNNNQRISSNPRNRQIAQPGMNMGQDRQMQMVGGNANKNLNRNGNLVVARAEGNATGDAAYLHTQLLIAQKEKAGIQLQAEEFDLMAAAADLDEIKEVNANCILMANLQQASTSSTQTDKALVYDSDGSAEKQQSLYDGKVLFEKNDPPVVHDSEETLQLAQENATKFVGDFKFLAKEADESLAKHKALELEFKHLLRAVVSQDIMSVVQNISVGETSNLQTELERVDNTKTIRPQPRRNTMNDSVPSASKSSRSKNKEVEVEEHHRKLLLSRNKKHMSSECNNVKLATQNVKSKVFCAMSKQCLISVNHDECLLSYVNGMTSRGCSKHMTENLQLLINFVWKFLGTVRFRNDHVAAILGQFCDSDLEVAFRRNAWFIKNLEGVDLLSGNRTTNLYTINLYEMAFASLICLMARASSTKSWLWHQHLSYLNFDTINDLAKNDLVSDLPKFKYHKEHLCPSCEQGKSKRASHPPKLVLNSRRRLHLLHMDLCGPMRIASINGKRDTACFTQNRSIIHRCFNKTPYELIKGRKPDISFLYVFMALCYLMNDHEDIGKLGAKGDIGFFIGYSADSCAYIVYNRRTKKIMETINVSFDELSAMAFKQRSS